MSQTKQDFTATDDKWNCPSCGSVNSTRYCSSCGEKKLVSSDFSMHHFLEQTIEGFTHFDNKFFRTIRTLVTRPGELSTSHFEGARVNYMKPMQLFVVVNILFFLLTGKYNIYSQPLSTFYLYTPYTYFDTKQVINSIAPTEDHFIALASRFHDRLAVESKGFLFLLIPYFSFFSLAAFYGKRKYLAEHLVFGTHYFTFTVLFQLFLSVCISKPFYMFFAKNGFSAGYDAVSSLISLSVFSIYYVIAARKFYNASLLRAVNAAGILAVFHIIGLWGYRLLLFFKIINSFR